MAGRPSKLTPEVQLKVCCAILDGNFRSTASRVAGVSERTFRKWLALGRQFPAGIYGQFLHAVLEAEGIAEAVGVKAVIQAGEADARHWEWWLERKHPHHWGRAFRVEMRELQGRLKKLEALLESQGLEPPA